MMKVQRGDPVSLEPADKLVKFPARNFVDTNVKTFKE